MGAKEIRYEIGAEILLKMDENGDLPLSDIFRLSKIMIEYFRAEGYADDLKENGYKWRPTREYFKLHMEDFRRILRTQGKFFEYLRPENDFKGEWKFVNKQEYETILSREHSDIGTRTENHNEKIDNGNEKWKLEIPKIAEVPLLTNDNKDN